MDAEKVVGWPTGSLGCARKVIHPPESIYMVRDDLPRLANVVSGPAGAAHHQPILEYVLKLYLAPLFAIPIMHP